MRQQDAAGRGLCELTWPTETGACVEAVDIGGWPWGLCREPAIAGDGARWVVVELDARDATYHACGHRRPEPHVIGEAVHAPRAWLVHVAQDRADAERYVAQHAPSYPRWHARHARHRGEPSIDRVDQRARLERLRAPRLSEPARRVGALLIGALGSVAFGRGARLGRECARYVLVPDVDCAGVLAVHLPARGAKEQRAELVRFAGALLASTCGLSPEETRAAIAELCGRTPAYHRSAELLIALARGAE